MNGEGLQPQPQKQVPPEPLPFAPVETRPLNISIDTTPNDTPPNPPVENKQQLAVAPPQITKNDIVDLAKGGLQAYLGRRRGKFQALTAFSGLIGVLTLGGTVAVKLDAFQANFAMNGADFPTFIVACGGFLLGLLILQFPSIQDSAADAKALETRIATLTRIAEDPRNPPDVRSAAMTALADIDTRPPTNSN